MSAGASPAPGLELFEFELDDFLLELEPDDLVLELEPDDLAVEAPEPPLCWPLRSWAVSALSRASRARSCCSCDGGPGWCLCLCFCFCLLFWPRPRLRIWPGVEVRVVRVRLTKSACEDGSVRLTPLPTVLSTAETSCGPGRKTTVPSLSSPVCVWSQVAWSASTPEVVAACHSASTTLPSG